MNTIESIEKLNCVEKERIKIEQEKEAMSKMTHKRFFEEQIRDLLQHTRENRAKLNSDIRKAFLTCEAKIWHTRTFYLDVRWLQFKEYGMELHNLILFEPDKIIPTIEYVATDIANLDSLENTEDYSSIGIYKHNLQVKVAITGLENDEYALKTAKRMSWHRTIQELQPYYENKMIVVIGTIKSKTGIFPVVQRTIFRCSACMQEIIVPNIDNRIEKPKRCINSTCKSHSFEKASEITIPHIAINIQDTPEYTDAGDLRSTRVTLKDNLALPEADLKLCRGKKVKVYGILRTKEKITKENPANAIKEFCIEANNIEVVDDDYSELSLTEQDIEKIKSITNPLEYFSEKLYGGIYGYDSIKTALLLQMTSCPKFIGNNMEKRGNIHIFLIGDAGTSKSQLLKITSDFALKSNYASGKGSSGVGITASVTRDLETNQWVAEAGLFPLSHQGILCLDEFTHLTPEDKSALHEAMEQQQVSINKANVHITMIAETSLLASGNPLKARFDEYSDIFEQFDITPALANRFDLIFLLRDNPNAKKDEGVANKIFETTKSNPREDKTFFKKYLVYCKKIIPKIDEKFRQLLVDYYLSLRSNANNKGIPISPRQFESLLRLSQATARIHLRENVIESDIELAKNLISNYLKEISTDFITGEVDVSIIETGKSSSEYLVAQAIVKLLKGKDIVPFDEIYEPFKDKIDEFKFDRIMAKMRKEGIIFEPRNSFFKLF